MGSRCGRGRLIGGRGGRKAPRGRERSCARASVAPSVAMARTPPTPVSVLEWVRFPNGIWNLPPEFAQQIPLNVPHVRVFSPATREEAETLLPEAEVVLGFAVRPANFARASRL